MSAQLPADTFMAFRDFLQATRALRRSPAFTLTAVVTPALGIGASTAALPGSGTPRFGVGEQEGVLRPQFFLLRPGLPVSVAIRRARSRRERSRKFGNIERTAFRRLRELDAAGKLSDLARPGISLEALKKGRKGQYFPNGRYPPGISSRVDPSPGTLPGRVAECEATASNGT